ncbi:hypothetical protein DZF92_14495, partial [Clavibacter michiganensis subsp. insidiosus]|uniref:acetylxylan esterase n=1 Tax=Clavibacter michiganensis TaxID=28447 RepID=UPI000EDDAE90
AVAGLRDDLAAVSAYVPFLCDIERDGTWACGLRGGEGATGARDEGGEGAGIGVPPPGSA